MLPLTTAEICQIGSLTTADFECLVSLYSEAKYPPKEYQEFKRRFSCVAQQNTCIEAAMKWKWGHSGKSNYPLHHKKLIKQIEKEWPVFSQSKAKNSPQETFNYWKTALGPTTRYISIAFITHLIHSYLVPIIDQHNFRAMNHFMKAVRSNYKSKKKPSTWEDIEALGCFLGALAQQLKQRKDRVDRYLMMFGRHRAAS